MSRQFSYSNVPILRKRRNAFDLSHDLFTSMSVGTLYPLDVQEIYPGDTFKVDETLVNRVTTAFLRPVMDNLVMEVHHFFVPNRLTMDDWTAVMGENKETAWAPANPTDVPILTPNMTIDGTRYDIEPTSGTVYDYLTIPVVYNDDGTLIDATQPAVSAEVSVLPARAFALIYDEWFRDQNNIDPMLVQKGSSVVASEVPNNNDWAPNNYAGKLPKVAKMHDYFTSALPSPQKGDAVTFAGGSLQIPERLLPVSGLPLKSLGDARGTAPSLFPDNTKLASLLSDVGLTLWNNVGVGKTLLSDNPLIYVGRSGNATNLGVNNDANSSAVGAIYGYNTPTSSLGTVVNSLGITNQFAYDQGVSLDVNSVSVNELRYAIALQRMLEKDAIGGTRYTSLLLTHFGVSSPDSRLQRTEYLGGKMFPLNVQQVAQTSAATEDSPLAALGGYSLSNGRSGYTKGFVEHGYVITVGFIRQYRHTYQQGVEKFWTRSKRTQFFDPVFDGLGEQPIYKSELFALDATARQTPFGYRPAWDDLRGRQSHVTGQMRSGLKKSLDIWHFADYYENAPSLNESFINETSDYVDRALAVPAETSDQFIVDMHFKVKAYRPLSLYGTPSQLGIK